MDEKNYSIIEREYRKKYYIKNKDKIKEYDKLYRQNNKNIINDYYKNNKDIIQENNKKYFITKYHNDIIFKINVCLRVRLNRAIKQDIKSNNTINLIGCSIEQLKQHLEQQFKPGMTWKNYTFKGWHIDHIIPCSKFNMTKEEEQKKCFHYSNLQPLWAKENLSKGNKIIVEV
jgi:hypothetical protein